MHKNRGTFGPLPNSEEPPHGGMVKALVPFCGVNENSIFYDRLVSEVKCCNEPIVMNMRGAIQTWIDCIEGGIKRFTGIKVKLHFAEIVSPGKYSYRGDDLYCWVSMRDVRRLMKFINNNEELKDFLIRSIKFKTDPSSDFYVHCKEDDFRPLSYDCPPVFYESVFGAVLEHDVIYNLEDWWDAKFRFTE